MYLQHYQWIQENQSPFSFTFSISKQHAEDEGVHFSNSKLVDMCLNAINKSNVPKYKTQARIFQNQRAEGKKLDYATVEQIFNNMDFNLDRTTPSHHRANMSTHTSVDIPSNKINRRHNFKKGNNDSRNRQIFRTPTGFACGDPNHRIKDCTDQAKKDAYIARRKEKLKNKKASPARTKGNNQTTGRNQYACMAKISAPKNHIQSLNPQ